MRLNAPGHVEIQSTVAKYAQILVKKVSEFEDLKRGRHRSVPMISIKAWEPDVSTSSGVYFDGLALQPPLRLPCSPSLPLCAPANHTNSISKTPTQNSKPLPVFLPVVSCFGSLAYLVSGRPSAFTKPCPEYLVMLLRCATAICCVSFGRYRISRLELRCFTAAIVVASPLSMQSSGMSPQAL